MADLIIGTSQVRSLEGAAIAHGQAGAQVLPGQTVYKDGSEFKLADSNASAATADVKGISLVSASSGQPIAYQTGGPIRLGVTLVVGKTYVQSTTAGGIAPIEDLALGARVTILGVATSTGDLRMPPGGIFNSSALVP